MRTKRKRCIAASLIVVSMLTSCSVKKTSSTNIPTASDNVSNTSDVTENSTAAASKSGYENSENLNFDNAIIDVPEVSEVKVVDFERMDWTKTELLNSVVECANKFADVYDIDHINTSDLEIIYHDEIEDCGHGEMVGRNLVQVYNKNKKNGLSVGYNHFSCFFRARLETADISSLGAYTYFTSDSDRSIYNEATKLASKVTSDYKAFFYNPDLEMIPFQYVVDDNKKNFRYAVQYNGLLLNPEIYDSVDRDDPQAYGVPNYSTIIADNNDAPLMLQSYYNWKVKEKETYTEWLSFEEARDIVDEKISKSARFNVSRVDLMYSMKEVRDGSEEGYALSFSGDPSWIFTVNSTGLGEYPRLAFLVNAVTGEFSAYSVSTI